MLNIKENYNAFVKTEHTIKSIKNGTNQKLSPIVCEYLFSQINGTEFEQAYFICLNQPTEQIKNMANLIKFAKVRDYVWDHKNATMEEISEQNEVSVKQIKQWIREERLVFTDDSTMGIECENCGAMIKSGRFCDKCKAEMSNNLSTLIKKPQVEAPVKKKKDGDRMRFLDS